MEAAGSGRSCEHAGGLAAWGLGLRAARKGEGGWPLPGSRLGGGRVQGRCCRLQGSRRVSCAMMYEGIVAVMLRLWGV